MAEPASTLYIFEGVPLPRDHSHIIWFEHHTGELHQVLRDRQLNFFMKWHAYTENNMSQIRIARGYVESHLKYTGLDNVNYIMIHNRGDNNYYWAFIDKIEYINDRNTKIYFTIDGIMTYQYAFRPLQCFVERTHVSDDRIGANTVPEGLEAGRMIYDTPELLGFGGQPIWQEVPYDNPENPNAKTAKVANFKFVMAIASTTIHPISLKGSPIRLEVFDTLVEINDFLTKMKDLSEIVAMYMVPEVFVKTGRFQGEYGDECFEIKGSINRPASIGGYRPKNNKLFTYPYMYITITNNSGSFMTYRWEDGQNGNEFNYVVAGDMSPGGKPILIPYIPGGGSDKLDNRAVGQSISLPPYPNIPVPNDSFAAWLAQNQNSVNVSNLSASFSGITGITSAIGGLAGGAIIGGMAGGIPGAVVGAGTNLVSSISTGVNSYLAVKQNMAKIEDAKAMPDYVRGLDAPDLIYQEGGYEFSYYPTHITAEFARIIDEFFTRFGYAVNRVMTPNLLTRERFTYIKTQDFQMFQLSGIPVFAQEEFRNTFNSGVTCWNFEHIDVNYTPGAEGLMGMYDYTSPNPVR